MLLFAGGYVPAVGRVLLIAWGLASLALILSDFVLWIAGGSAHVLALGTVVSCGGMIARWAYARTKSAALFRGHS